MGGHYHGNGGEFTHEMIYCLATKWSLRPLPQYAMYCGAGQDGTQDKDGNLDWSFWSKQKFSRSLDEIHYWSLGTWHKYTVGN